MPITQRQIDRVLADNILPAEMDAYPLSMRYAEAYVRRKLYAWEDGAVIDMDKLFKAAYADIRSANAAISERLGVSNKLVSGAAGMQWRDALYSVIVDVTNDLRSNVSMLALERSTTAYYAGYLGRAWGLSVSTIDTAPKPRISLVNTYTAQGRIRDEWMARFGDEWDQSFAQPFVKFASAARAALTSAMISDGETPADGLRRVKELMGVESYRRLYYEAQTNIRTAIMAAGNLGGLALALDNQVMREAVGGIGAVMIFITAGDGKVCPECRPFAGRMWRLDTLNGLIGAGLTALFPPLHHNCRCTVIMLPLPEFLLPPDVPPGLTWAEYLIFEGLEGVLDPFMDRRQLDSSQTSELSYLDYYA